VSRSGVGGATDSAGKFGAWSQWGEVASRRHVLRSGALGICLLASICSIVLPLSAQAQKPDKVSRLAVL